MKVKKILLGLSLMFVLSNSVGAQSVNVRRGSSEKMSYSQSGIYQEAFYDYGTLIPYDNAKITAISRGNSNNYALIKYSDEAMSQFKTVANSVKDKTPREYSYTSDYDVLDSGSRAYSTGAVELELNVVK